MTNREFYKEQILDIVCSGDYVAIDKNTRALCGCNDLDCGKCLFYNNIDPPHSCREKFAEWSNTEYCPFKKDELVEVSNDEKNWVLRHFSHKDNQRYYVFMHGSKSNELDEIIAYPHCQKYGTLGKTSEF